ncbi:signal peptidase II [Rosettibacter firmus]|uniref:signal peptidase II n=1 Tax=Rosettibacter firmus TaxID=3111522 RepID=UPI00336BC4E7
MKVLYTTLVIVVLDQISKFLVKGINIPILNIKIQGMEYGESINVIGDFFKITFVENPGLAFGINVNDSSKLILSIFSLIASIGIFYFLYKSKNQKFIVKFALALILGGAIGNLIDRTFYGLFYGYAPLFYGKVVDFFNVDFFDFTIFGKTYDRWPIFNIADASVSIGVVLLMIFHKSVEEKTQEDKEEVIIKETVTSTDNNEDVVATNSTIKNVEDNFRKEN